MWRRKRVKKNKNIVDDCETCLTVINNLSDFITVIDKDYRILLINNSFKNYIKNFGIKNNALGKSLFEFFPFLEKKVKREYQQVFKNKKKLITEEISLIKNKKIFTSTQKIPIFDKNKKVIQILTVIKDTTEKKESEEKLNQIQKRFKDIVFSSGDWVWETDDKGKYVYVSGKVEKILGYKPKELLGKEPFEFMSEDGKKEVLKKFTHIIDNKKIIKDLENENITKSGKRVYLLTNGVPVFDDNKKFVGYRGVDKDVSKNKEYEIKLREKIEDLKKLNKFMVGRELKMLDLKQKLKKIKK